MTQSFKVGARSVEWARSLVHPEHMETMEEMQKFHSFSHWSRLFEYPWAFLNGKFEKGQWGLDAAGGDGAIQHAVAARGVQLVNMDIDPSRQPPSCKGAVMCRGDLFDMRCFQGEIFDRVLCISALEHLEKPEKILPELWRVLKPGGRLLVTFDVAHYARHNHTINEEKAQEILAFFGLHLPRSPVDVLVRVLAEEGPVPGEPKEVELKVICFRADKME